MDFINFDFMQKVETSIYSVSNLIYKIKSILDHEDIKNIGVRGEISNLSRSDAGHIYFSLKDENSLLRCAFFSFKNQFFDLDFLQNGKEVNVFGSISVFDKGGYFNLNVTKIKEIGEGNIYQKIEKLKKKLHEKGFFDSHHKKTISQFNFNIGIATSATGAAIEDIIKISTQRFPNINLLIAPCVVQGEHAPNSIITAIELLNNKKWNLDIIIAGRGGGSFEDLIAFNDEKVAMSFFKSRLPIISAVGHQIDSVISDFMADAYTATPTAAAELVVPDIFAIKNDLSELSERIEFSIYQKIKNESQKIKMICRHPIFTDAYLLLQNPAQKLDSTCIEINSLAKETLYLLKQTLSNFKNLDSYIKISLPKFSQKLDQLKNRIEAVFIKILNQKKKELLEAKKVNYLITQILQKQQKQFEVLSEKVESYSHRKTLSRGYSIVRNMENQIISDASKVQTQEKLEIILHKGKLQVTKNY